MPKKMFSFHNLKFVILSFTLDIPYCKLECYKINYSKSKKFMDL